MQRTIYYRVCFCLSYNWRIFWLFGNVVRLLQWGWRTGGLDMPAGSRMGRIPVPGET